MVSVKVYRKDKKPTDRRMWRCLTAKREKDKWHNGAWRSTWFLPQLKRQDYKCGICQVPIGASAHEDHDHSCCPDSPGCEKCRRGLLCAACNLGLGNFKDDVEVLQAAVVYLERRGCSSKFIGIWRSGSAPGWGPGGGRFDPCYPDWQCRGRRRL
jgi:hypothetical protein